MTPMEHIERAADGILATRGTSLYDRAVKIKHLLRQAYCLGLLDDGPTSQVPATDPAWHAIEVDAWRPEYSIRDHENASASGYQAERTDWAGTGYQAGEEYSQ